ncbi:leucine-rich repeat domain-containing protein [Chitinophaga pinensis]|uniref:Leucine-rich repeat protein n=1 Tax=Chitinophaga pinensis (strain ATCC 43595 / DSM 2588 / LMG 13176 / NBRC 15968 / NCIMB 11800 / UQM 2034) TaxID=485918 RepID=A0A979G795_CHIPD|nr:leucine-rich repeat domain-containing protein [Chitinophaga pinensis]ACU62066.1 leucine-rich repeat protein [Chitinophaga pinensis DSM 2588]
MPVLLTKEAIHQQFDMKLYDPISRLDHNRIIYFDGDTTINGNLSSDWATTILETLNEDTDLGNVLIMVNGNLTVKGNINIGDYHPLLLVLGDVHCDVLKSGDDTIHIAGDAHIRYAFFGNYNDGSIRIEGTTYVPYVLNSDHDSSINPRGAILINTYSDHNDFFEYDYTQEVLPQVMVPATFNEHNEFDEWQFIALVKAGQSPFVEGAKPTRLVHQEELEKLIAGNIDEIVELDLSEKKMKVFPTAITKLRHLKKLILSKNNISEIPAAIGELQQLEELYMYNSGIKTIHEAIGQLKQLRVLDLGGNYDLDAYPDAIGALSNLQVLKNDYMAIPLPDSLASLEKLEELSMYGCYNHVNAPAPFPEVITRLKNLKRFDFRENNIQELPSGLLNVQTLEEFQWTGSRTHSPNFPNFTGFKQLKKLVISKKFLGWKAEVFDITTLEHLAIDRNKEEKEFITQDTLDLMNEMAADENEDFREHLEWIKQVKQPESGGRFSYILHEGMKPEDLQDIHKLQRLKYLDLSFNGLAWLPETFFELQHLEHLNLKYNNFPDEVKERINTTFSGTTINW